ncbi:restriction endonuclease subunit S [Pseudomonas guariconensis]|uniref:restriction endonuclease subunit S n=1 Tax=Pseudomonas TaxID=286 RepID=UPI0020978959|nr:MULTISPECIES: restriction endonuclease subunit S [Pseudomonas]MCO7517864.1 restriction endonuclease subunit S [Pseudomonas putida]MCO7608367.1 restriction endonuclease subunit S [Pseudomonas guariconensis]
MSSEWTFAPLEECLDALIDYRGKTPEKTSFGIPLITAKIIKNGRIEKPTEFIAVDNYDSWMRRGIPLEGDVVLTVEAPLGEVAQLGAEKIALAQRVVTLRGKKGLLDNTYLLYLLQTEEMLDQLKARATGTTVLGIKQSELRKVQLSLPPVDQQIAAARILRALDDRITLLRETNATLEAIAQALFKSWFVDFDPVRAKAEGRQPEGMDATTAALFPDSFEESELGLVPKGWRVMPLGDICSVTIGGLWGNDDSDDSELVPAISLRGVDLEHLRANGFSKEAPVRWVKTTAMEKRRLSDREVLVAASGAGPCGRPLWAGAPFEVIYGRPVIFSNFVKRLDCGSPARAVYVDRLLAEMRESSEIWNFINGTSVPNLDDKLLLSTKRTVLPPDEVLSKFFDVAKTIYDSLYDQKAQTLTQLRDTLLPRLISGQLRLPEAEALLENAL